MELFPVRMIDIKEEAPGIHTFCFDIPEGLTWEEGAHLHLAFPDFMESGRKDPEKVRHMSLSSLPDENRIAITTRLNGSSPFKLRLAQLSRGDSMILYKIGSRLSLRRDNRPLKLISMGVGLAAFRPLLLACARQSDGIPALTSLTAVRPGEELFHQELGSLGSERLRQIYFHHRGDLIKALSQQAAGSIFYIVGSELFLRDIIRHLRLLGIPDEDIIIDKKPEVRAMFLQTMELISERPLILS